MDLGEESSLHGVNNAYIGKAIDDLFGFVGVKEDIPPESVFVPLRDGRTKECIERIAEYLGLPVTVSVIISERFDSRDVVTTDDSGRGREGITAQVSIPDSLPFYGTPALQGFPIQVRVSGNARRYPHTFMAIMAHELSHIVLHSLWHTEKDNEIYTDVAAMLLGFAGVMRRGRHIEETTQIGMGWTQRATTQFGYLTDYQFEFALGRVSAILKSSKTEFDTVRTRVTQTLATYRKQLDSYRKMLCEFRSLIEYLDKNPGKRIRKQDIPKVVEAHGLDYGERLVSVLRSSEKKLREAELLHSGWLEDAQRHYSGQRLDSLRVLHDSLNGLLPDLTRECGVLKDDVAVMKRCVGFFGRLKANSSSHERLTRPGG